MFILVTGANRPLRAQMDPSFALLTKAGLTGRGRACESRGTLRPVTPGKESKITVQP